MFLVGELGATVGADTKGFDSAIDAVHKKGQQVAQSVSREFQKMGQQFTGIGTKLTAGVTLPLAALSNKLVHSASDAEEVKSKFNTVFSEISESANSASKDLVKNFGLSSTASQKLLSDTGDLLTGFGFTQNKALELSEGVNKLAVDLASFTNYSGGAEGASQALTKALLGERESVKALGISILEEDVKSQMLIDSKKGLTFASDRQAKAYATLQLAQRQSKNAIGDFARTQNSFANQTRQLKAELSDLAVNLGQQLLPSAKAMIGITRNLVKRFMALSPEIKENIVTIASLAAAIGPVLVGVGTLMKLVPVLSAGFAALTGPIGLTVLGLSALSAGIIYARDNWEAIKERVSDIGWWKNAIIDMTQFLIEYSPISLMIKQLNAALSFFGQATIPNPFEAFAENLEELKVETKEYENDFGSFMEAVKNGLSELTNMEFPSLFGDQDTEGVDIQVNGNVDGEGIKQQVRDIVPPPMPITPVLKTEALEGSLGALMERLNMLRRAQQNALNPQVYTEIQGLIDGTQKDIEAFTGSVEKSGNQSAQSMKSLEQGIGGVVGQLISGKKEALDFGSIISRIGPMLINILTGGSGGFLSGLAGSLFGGFREKGGPIEQGKWYIAGERGPEPIWGGGPGAMALGYDLPSPDINIPTPSVSSPGMDMGRLESAFVRALQTLDLKVDSEGIYVASVRGEGDWNR